MFWWFSLSIFLSKLFHRHSKQPWEAAIFGFCILRVRTGTAPFPTCTARCGFSAAAHHDGGGGAAAQRPVGLPVEMSTGNLLITKNKDRFTLCFHVRSSEKANLKLNPISSKNTCDRHFSLSSSFFFLTEGYLKFRVCMWHDWEEDLHHGSTSGLCTGWLNCCLSVCQFIILHLSVLPRYLNLRAEKVCTVPSHIRLSVSCHSINHLGLVDVCNFCSTLLKLNSRSLHSQHPSYHHDFLRLFKEYLHSQGCVHGNVGARSVLVGGDLTAKLWGLGSAYRRRAQANSPGEVEDMEMRKWQAPEVLSRRAISQSSDVWVSEPWKNIK